MTVLVVVQKEPFVGNGVSKTFNYAYPMFDADYCLVELEDDNGVPQIVPPANYSVTVNETNTGGAVTFTIAPSNGRKGVIKRIVPITQPSDWIDGGAVSQETFENGVDKLTLICIQQQEELDRCPKFKSSSAYKNVTFPDLGLAKAGKGLKVSADGGGLEWTTSNVDTLLQDTQAVHDQAVADTQAIYTDTVAARDVAVSAKDTAVAKAADATTQAGIATTQATNAATSAAEAHGWALTASVAVNGGVKIDPTDTIADSLSAKMLAGEGISFTTNNVGGNKSITVTNPSIITADKTLDVGDGQPYATVNAAFAYLSTKRIAPNATVTIRLHGIVNETASTTIDHPDCGRIIIEGSFIIDPITTWVSASVSSGVYTITLNVTSSANMAVGDIAYLHTGSGNNWVDAIRGSWIISQIVSATQIKMRKTIGGNGSIMSVSASSLTLRVYKDYISFANNTCRFLLNNGSEQLTLKNIAIKGAASGLLKSDYGMRGNFKVVGVVATFGTVSPSQNYEILADAGGGMDITIARNEATLSCSSLLLLSLGNVNIVGNGMLVCTGGIMQLEGGSRIVGTGSGTLHACGLSYSGVIDGDILVNNLVCNANGIGLSASNARIGSSYATIKFNGQTGLQLIASQIYLLGGNISSNLGGVYATGSFGRLYGVSIASNSGSGIQLARNSSFVVENGSITSNLNGGCLVSNGSTLSVNSITITSNTSYGLRAQYGSCISVDNCTMSGNTSDLVATNNSAIDRISGTYAGLSPAAQTVGNLNSYIS